MRTFMIIRDRYPVQNNERVIERPRRGMGYEGVDSLSCGVTRDVTLL
jgi:hypothetical protein